MSHGDKLGKLPEGFVTIATTQNSPYAGIAHETKPIFGLQFHPEVTHSLRGKDMLKNFAVGICGAKANWNMSNFIDQEIVRIRSSSATRLRSLAPCLAASTLPSRRS